MYITKPKLDRDDVIDFIQTASASDLLQILDSLIDPVSNLVGMATGIEDDRHNVFMLVQAEEAEEAEDRKEEARESARDSLYA